MNPASNFPSQVQNRFGRSNNTNSFPTQLQNNMSLRREDQTMQAPLKPQTPANPTMPQNSFSNQQAYTALRSTLSTTPNISPQKPNLPPSSNVPSTAPPQIGNQSPKFYKPGIPNQVHQNPPQTLQHNQHQSANSIPSVNTTSDMETQDSVSSEKYSLLNSQIALVT